METRTVVVSAIHCGHCTETIRLELGQLEGVEAVDATVESREVTIRFGPPATWERIVYLLREIGFPPSD